MLGLTPLWGLIALLKGEADSVMASAILGLTASEMDCWVQIPRSKLSRYGTLAWGLSPDWEQLGMARSGFIISRQNGTDMKLLGFWILGPVRRRQERPWIPLCCSRGRLLLCGDAAFACGRRKSGSWHSICPFSLGSFCSGLQSTPGHRRSERGHLLRGCLALSRWRSIRSFFAS